MGEARASRSPVLHLGTQADTRTLAGTSGRGVLHESPEQRELMASVCVASTRARTASEVLPAVARSARSALAGRRGPAFVEIPHDLLAAPSDGALPKTAPFPARKRPLHDAVAEAARLLERARSPVVWAGAGVAASEGSASLVRLAEVLDAPVVTTFGGKGTMPPDHELCVGLPPHQPEVTDLIARSDAIVVAGSDLDGHSTQGWRLRFPHPRIAINVVGDDARRNYAADLVLEADADASLAALADACAPRRRSAAGRVAALRAAALADLRADRRSAEPLRFVERLGKAVPPDAIVIGDMAVPGYWCAAYLPVARPRGFAFPLGWGTLGFAFPAALGAAASGRRAIVVAGDAGFLFGAAELATAVQERLAITVVVVNDGGYGMLRYDEDERYGERFAVDLATPDFVALAKAFGAHARAATPAQIGDALAWAAKRSGPSVIEVAAAWDPPLTTSPRWPLKGKPEARP
jgi:acetolactate synthase-1/2/3 large subunit